MKNCMGCKYADWQRTSNGRLHPSGDGKCTYPYKLPQLPESMYFINTPHVCGGQINRKKTFKDNCAYYGE